jgi:hypothetical protein
MKNEDIIPQLNITLSQLKAKIYWVCNTVFEFSMKNKFFSEKIYIETATKKNAMYGAVGISKGYTFKLITDDNPCEFRFYADNNDPFMPTTNKEGIEYNIKAKTVSTLVNKVAASIVDTFK